MSLISSYSNPVGIYAARNKSLNSKFLSSLLEWCSTPISAATHSILLHALEAAVSPVRPKRQKATSDGGKIYRPKFFRPTPAEAEADDTDHISYSSPNLSHANKSTNITAVKQSLACCSGSALNYDCINVENSFDTVHFYVPSYTFLSCLKSTLTLMVIFLCINLRAVGVVLPISSTSILPHMGSRELGKLKHSTVSFPDVALEWRLGYKRVKFLESTKYIPVVNDSFPGPTLRVRVGELVRVTVHNSLREETSIHWHGIRQWGTPWSDGR